MLGNEHKHTIIIIERKSEIKKCSKNKIILCVFNLIGFYFYQFLICCSKLNQIKSKYNYSLACALDCISFYVILADFLNFIFHIIWFKIVAKYQIEREKKINRSNINFFSGRKRKQLNNINNNINNFMKMYMKIVPHWKYP